METRPPLRVVLMSATLDASRLATYVDTTPRVSYTRSGGTWACRNESRSHGRRLVQTDDDGFSLSAERFFSSLASDTVYTALSARQLGQGEGCVLAGLTPCVCA